MKIRLHQYAVAVKPEFQEQTKSLLLGLAERIKQAGVPVKESGIEDIKNGKTGFVIGFCDVTTEKTDFNAMKKNKTVEALAKLMSDAGHEYVITETLRDFPFQS